MDSLEPIKRRIYEIRGRKVMLDSDLAELYVVETKNLKRAVRANIERFPDDFMFELTKEEYNALRCKNFTLKIEDDSLRCKNFTSNKRGGNRYLPFAFTREGIAMLSGLLRSHIAIQANINIMRAFFQMQEALLIVGNTQLQLEQIRSEVKQLRTDLNETLSDQNEINEDTRAQLEAISEALNELQNQGKNSQPLPEIGYAAIQKRIDEEEKKKKKKKKK
ncbi:MAG: ORF6N domain-containing protein [Bacteroidaceae bacterium]|nr:ORF6N domain-containing protein [Bacteroidaceae bacterium]